MLDIEKWKSQRCLCVGHREMEITAVIRVLDIERKKSQQCLCVGHREKEITAVVVCWT